jgi:serine protease DegQ
VLRATRNTRRRSSLHGATTMPMQKSPSAFSVVVLALVFGVLGGGIGAYLYGRGSGKPQLVPAAPVTALPAQTGGGTKVEVVTDQDAIVNAVKKISPAVVKITGAREPRNMMELMMSGGVISGVGSGVIFKYEGRHLVLTNMHVIGDFTDLTLKLADGRELKARPLGRKVAEDLAVLEVLGEPQNLVAANLGDSDKLEPGQWVFAVGNPFNYEHTVTVGVVSAVGLREVGGEQRRVIQTDASINAGNSGGPLVDLAGNVIGINYKIYDPQGNPVATSVGIGFAIPINEAKELLYFLVHRGPFVGLAHVIPNSVAFSQAFQIGTDKGLVIMGIYTDGPADKAGLRVRDAIVAVDGKPVNNGDEFQKAIFRHKIGDTIRFTVQRGERKMDVDVPAGTAPEDIYF